MYVDEDPLHLSSQAFCISHQLNNTYMQQLGMQGHK